MLFVDFKLSNIVRDGNLIKIIDFGSSYFNYKIKKVPENLKLA